MDSVGLLTSGWLASMILAVRVGNAGAWKAAVNSNAPGNSSSSSFSFSSSFSSSSSYSQEGSWQEVTAVMHCPRRKLLFTEEFIIYTLRSGRRRLERRCACLVAATRAVS
jgi:hypothetical protein